jgi:predicted RNase H-like HicB family nuclease
MQPATKILIGINPAENLGAVQCCKEADQMTNRIFTIAIQKEDDWFVAKCLENNVASQGKNMDEAIGNLREALELYYEDEALPAFKQTFVTTLEVAL